MIGTQSSLASKQPISSQSVQDGIYALRKARNALHPVSQKWSSCLPLHSLGALQSLAQSQYMWLSRVQ